MFYYLAKSFWFVAQPLNLSIILLALALLAALLRWRRTAGTGFVLSFLVLALSTWTTLGALLLSPLEERFARNLALPDTVDGIIVLGGGFNGEVNEGRGGYELNVAGDRFVETAVLARRFPSARILVSGGAGDFILGGEGDAETAPRLLSALGVTEDRLLLEGRSRDTYENAVFSKELANPQPGQTWLLVTSAFHMPRSMALFRKAGFEVVAWPTDYRTAGNEGFGLFPSHPVEALQDTGVAIREWIGLLAYWLAGRIDSPFPG